MRGGGNKRQRKESSSAPTPRKQKGIKRNKVESFEGGAEQRAAATAASVQMLPPSKRSRWLAGWLADLRQLDDGGSGGPETQI